MEQHCFHEEPTIYTFARDPEGGEVENAYRSGHADLIDIGRDREGELMYTDFQDFRQDGAIIRVFND